MPRAVSRCRGEKIDVASLQRLVDEPLPERAGTEVAETYRLKLLRGLANAHFLAKATRSNRPPGR